MDIKAAVVGLVLLGLSNGLVAEAESFARGELIENVACEADSAYTYALYLPSSYSRDREWPLLLVFDPAGRGAVGAEVFREAAEQYGWIVVGSDNVRNGPWEPSYQALRVLWPDVHLRFATNKQRVYAAGFSGGAVMAWNFELLNDHLNGIISVGGRLPQGAPTDRFTFIHYGVAGTGDFNHLEMRQVDELLAQNGVVHRLEIVDGPHQWCSPEQATAAVAWMELQAMKQNLRDRDDTLVARLFAKDLTGVREMEERGRLLEALRRYRAIGVTFYGLRDVSAVGQKVAALEKDQAVLKAEKEERAWEEYERNYLRFKLPAMNLVGDPATVVGSQRLLAALNVSGLKKQSDEPGLAGHVADRLLGVIFYQAYFALSEQFLRDHKYREAMTVLEVAAEVQDQEWWPQYNLACAAALAKSKKKAVKALKRAVELGFDNLEWMSQDSDLDSIRREAGYQELVARLGGG